MPGLDGLPWVDVDAGFTGSFQTCNESSSSRIESHVSHERGNEKEERARSDMAGSSGVELKVCQVLIDW